MSNDVLDVLIKLIVGVSVYVCPYFAVDSSRWFQWKLMSGFIYGKVDANMNPI